VDAQNTIQIGGLANNPLFFGTATAEIVATAANTRGGWNGDFANSVYTPTRLWFIRGGRPNETEANLPGTGIFAFYGASAGVDATSGHRTILSGY
jgi:hypothetical protein